MGSLKEKVHDERKGEKRGKRRLGGWRRGRKARIRVAAWGIVALNLL